MTSKKIIIFALILVIIIASFVTFGYRHNSTTTTPQAVNTISFGSLTNTYTDNQYDFSFNYPEKLIVRKSPSNCSVSITELNNTSFSLNVSSPSCPSPFANLQAKSLSDYMQDYVIDHLEAGEKLEIHILNTTDIVTLSGAKGIKQEYTSTLMDSKTGANIHDGGTNTRYIFYSSQKGLYILEPSYSSGVPSETLTLFQSIEKNIIDTVVYK